MSASSKIPSNSEETDQYHSQSRDSDVGLGVLREKAIRFLNSPLISHLSKEVKVEYLKGKGLTMEDIDLLHDDINTRQCDVMWNNTETKTHQHHHKIYPNHGPLDENEPSTSNPVVPITIGGVIAIVGLAAFRWLNGQDFVLFPKTLDTYDSGVDIDSITHDREEIQNKNSILYQRDNELDEKYDTNRDIALNKEVKELQTSIENLVQLQKDTKRLLESDRAAKVTDYAMNSLRKASSMNNNLERNMLKSINVQISECKGTFDLILDQVESARGDAESIQIEIFKVRDISLKLESIICLLSDEIKKISKASDDDILNIEKNVDGINLIKNDNINGSQINGDATSEIIKEQNGCKRTTQSSFSMTIDSDMSAKIIEDAKDASIAIPCHSIVLPSREAFYATLGKLRECNSSSAIKSAVQMLYLHISNLIDKPSMNQYHRVSTKSTTFKNKISNVAFASQILESVGFVLEGNFFEYRGGSESEMLSKKDISSNTNNSLALKSRRTQIESDELEFLKEAANALRQLL